MQASGINKWEQRMMSNMFKKILEYFRKLFKLDTTEADAAEFQPDAIYLENQKPGVPLQTVWYLILLLFVIGIIWACNDSYISAI